mmetsp:Transcript_13663/g.36787  ORF Transcript_13663/g.36787 Transcript_13663/m.36787 type:complete len:732 (-) Transcript_13663:281-2476(-)
MDRACCRRRPATNKRGGRTWADDGQRRASESGARIGAGETAAGASKAKRPRGTPPLPGTPRVAEAENSEPAGSASAASSSSSSSTAALCGDSATPVPTAAATATDGAEHCSVDGCSAGPAEVAPAAAPPHSASRLPTLLFDGLRRDEIVRLMLQALADLGFPSSSAALELESGICVEPEEVTTLRRAVFAAEWAEATRAADQLSGVPAHLRQTIRFFVMRQKFFEQVAQRSVDVARACWQELSAAAYDVDSRRWLQQARDYMRCSSEEDLERASGWRPEGSREALWDRIQFLLPASSVVPPRRLSVLLWQALRYQELHCLHHSLGVGFGQHGPHSLLRDHVCKPPPLPAHCVAQLDGHSDEVWFVAASHGGQYLASASRDNTVLLWEHMPPSSFKTIGALSGHAEPCSILAWSPNDKYLLTAAGDCTVRLWAPPSAQVLRTFSRHASPVTGVGWLSDSWRFVTAGYDRRVCLWDAGGAEIQQWEVPSRIQDLTVMRNGTRVLVVNSDQNLKIIDVLTRRELPALPEGDAVTSVCASKLRDDVLVNIAHQASTSQLAPVIRLWDIAARRVAQRYLGHSQGRFVVRSCFGGQSEEFVISGSEDAKVYIWHRHYGSLLQVLLGHAATVNSVCWAILPRRVGSGSDDGFYESDVAELLISASDDHSLRVWGPSQEPASDCLTALLNGSPLPITSTALAGPGPLEGQLELLEAATQNRGEGDSEAIDASGDVARSG